MFKFFKLSGKAHRGEATKELIAEAFRRGFFAGERLTALGIESVLARVKKIDTWDNDLKAEIIAICSDILEAKKM